MRSRVLLSSEAGKALISGLLLLGIILLGGCQLIGKSGQGPEPAQHRVYQGFLTLDGGDIPAGLELIQLEGRRVRGALQTNAGLQADGEGTLRGGILEIELVYGGDCPGRMLLQGEWNQSEGSYEGEVRATDCTGRAEGNFRFSADASREDQGCSMLSAGDWTH